MRRRRRSLALIATLVFMSAGCEEEARRDDLRVDPQRVDTQRIDKPREDKMLPTWKEKEKSWWEW